jgi:CRP-like cAMP-binding protein
MEPIIRIFEKADDFTVYAPGQIIFRENDAGDFMYVIKAGAVDIVLHDTVVNTVGTGSVIGEMALIEDRPRSATAIANGECQLVPVNRQRFAFLVQETPYFALQLMSIMASRLRRMDQRVA